MSTLKLFRAATPCLKASNQASTSSPVHESPAQEYSRISPIVPDAVTLPSCTDFSFHVVNNLKRRKQAYALAYQVYLEKGYLQPNVKELIVHPQDAESSTFTILAKDKNGRSAGTATLYFDSAVKLPADRVFSKELHPLRTQGKEISEVTRLAMDPIHRNSKPLLLGLFNLISIFARRIRNASDFVIEVHPRHANFYKRLLCFEEMGTERPCPHVKGSPAILLRLDLARQASEINRQTKKQINPKHRNPRNLYARFTPLNQEAPLAETMLQTWKPMTPIEALYFDVHSHK